MIALNLSSITVSTSSAREAGQRTASWIGRTMTPLSKQVSSTATRISLSVR